MVGIVGEVGYVGCLDVEVETAVHPAERGHGCSNLVGGGTGYLCQCHGCDAVFYVDAHGNAQAHVSNGLYGRDEVEHDLTAANADVLSVEVS